MKALTNRYVLIVIHASYKIKCKKYAVIRTLRLNRDVILSEKPNQPPSARDLQAFLVFSQHPAWVITPVDPCGPLHE